jgi:NTP pyrophosphatase (non-canonical NTP hydrolase)
MTEAINWDSMADVSAHINEWANRTFKGRKPKAALTKLTMEEIPELLMHLKHHGPNGIGQELADCFILLLDLAVIWKVNLPRAIHDKMQTNERRMWTKDEDLGHWGHAILTHEDKE